MRYRAEAIIVAATMTIWGLVRWVIYDFPQLGDTRVYQHAVRMIDAGFVPYRDFDIEYPPLATGVFWLVSRIPGPPTLVFSLAMGLCLAATAVATWVAGGQLRLSHRRRVGVTTIVALSPLLLGTLLQTRYDLVLAALLGWTLVAALAKRFGWMWVLLALATAIKLVPIVLILVLGIWHVHHRGLRAATRGGAVAGAIVAATLVPFLVLAPGGTWQLFQYHLARPLQMESFGSSLIQSLGLPFRQVSSYGSDNIDGALPAAAATLSTLAFVFAVALIARRFQRVVPQDPRPDALVAAMAATMLAAIVFGKVLSPQYLIWLLPAALLIRGRPGRLTAGLVALALPITQLIFPLLYTDLVTRSAPLPLGLLLLRNIMLGVALAAAVVAIAPRRRAPAPTPAASTRPVLSSSTPT